MIALAYLISYLTGFLSITLILRREYKLNFLYHSCLAILLGLGVNSTLTFFSLFIVGQYIPLTVLGINLFFLLCLVAAAFLLKDKIYLTINHSFHFAQILGLLFWLGLLGIIFFISTRYPFGDWDAWAIWSMKAKFIILGKENWHTLFNEISWHTHPDYPLLLPSIYSWMQSFSKSYYPIPQVLAIAFGFIGGLLIYSSLEQFKIRRLWCFLFATLILSHPFYAFLICSQYADIILACYLLASLSTAILFIRTQLLSFGLLSGLFVGLMTFTKNEGLMMALLLGTLVTLSFLLDKPLRFSQKMNLLKNYYLGIFITAASTLFLKLFLTSTGGDIVSGFAVQNVLNTPMERFHILLNEIPKYWWANRMWCYIWHLIFVMYLLGFKKLFYRENKILILFIICYIGTVLGVYLYTQLNVDLNWWIDRSFARVLLTLLPSAYFIGIYLHWRPESIDQK